MATGIFPIPHAVSLWSQLGIPKTATTYNCNWQEYRTLIITAVFYGNRLFSVEIPSTAFASTASQNRPMLTVFNGNTFIAQYEVWQNGNGKITAKASAQNNAYGLLIEGFNL